jgi:hypothetical protein
VQGQERRGHLNFGWDDGTTSTASVSGRFRRDETMLAPSGAFNPTDPAYPSATVKLLLDNFPRNPCLAATNPITGTAEITTQ